MKVSDVPGVRDRDASPFNAILIKLCLGSGALAAALVDAEGETVDYAGRIAPYDVRIAAAEWRIVLSLLQAANVPGWSSTNEVLVRTGRRSYALATLSEGYALVLVLPRGAFRVSRRALLEAVDELEREAGLLSIRQEEKLHWFRVAVRTEKGDARRPLAVEYDGDWRPVTILGRFQSRDLERREVGYLTRLASGAELVLVREPLGKWFAGSPRFVARNAP